MKWIPTMFCGWSFSVVGPLRPLSAFGLDQRYSTCIFMVTLKHGLGSLKVIWTDYMYWSATYDFLLTFRSNYGPIWYRFRDKRWFQISSESGQCIPAGCNAKCTAPWGKLIIISLVTIRNIWHDSAADFFAFWKISTTNFRILWRHLPTKLQHV